MAPMTPAVTTSKTTTYDGTAGVGECEIEDGGPSVFSRVLSLFVLGRHTFENRARVTKRNSKPQFYRQSDGVYHRWADLGGNDERSRRNVGGDHLPARHQADEPGRPWQGVATVAVVDPGRQMEENLSRRSSPRVRTPPCLSASTTRSRSLSRPSIVANLRGAMSDSRWCVHGANPNLSLDFGVASKHS